MARACRVTRCEYTSVRTQLLSGDPGPRPRDSAAATAAVITPRTALLVFSDTSVADDEWNKGPSPVAPDPFFCALLFSACGLNRQAQCLPNGFC